MAERLTPPGERAFRTRTRTGCITCKVKCDEAKPNCVKCTSTGRKCDGYELPNPPPRKDIHMHRNRIPFLFPRGFQYPQSEQEVRSLQFFYERTVPSLAGYCESEFWSGLVLQASQHENAVWHALIALGSLHENFENDQTIPGLWFSRRGDDRFAVGQYVSAINALRKSSCALPDAGGVGMSQSVLTVDVCLISCVLFVCIEIMSSRYVSAVKHIRNGIKILQEVRRDPRSGTYHHPFLSPSTVSRVEMDTLRKIFFRLQNQAFTLTRSDMDRSLLSELEGTSYDEVPTCFSSIAEAHDYMEHGARVFYREFHKMDSSESTQVATEWRESLAREYQVLLERWSTALRRFEESRGHLLTYKERIGLNTLHIHEYRYTILGDLANNNSTHACAWDKYNLIFEKIVSLAASVFDLTEVSGAGASSPPSPGHKPSFSLDLGIIPVLYDTATLCRDPGIRRRAVNLLRRSSRQEGLHNSHVSAAIAERVIALEEAVALGGALNDQQSLTFLGAVVLDQEERRRQQEQSQGHVQRSSQVPDFARLALAYPNFNMESKKAFFIGQGEGVDLRIPLPAMSAILDMDQ